MEDPKRSQATIPDRLDQKSDVENIKQVANKQRAASKRSFRMY